MSSIHRRVAVCALMLSAGSCAGEQRGEVAVSQAELDFSAGAVQGTLLWGGAPLSDQEADGLYAEEPGLLSFWITRSSYSVPNVTPGAHTLKVSLDQCRLGDESKLGESTFSVTAGSTTVADIDLTATTGKVKASIMVNGAPLSGARIQLDGSCSSSLYIGENGIFDRLLPPRTYTASVYDAAIGWGNLVGTVTLTVNAGEVTDLGAVDIPVGAVQGTLLWNGEPLSTQEADPLFAHEEGSFGFWINQSTYSIPNVTPGAHTLEVSLDQCKVGDETKLGESTFSVTAGSTTVADIDLTATAGKVKGSITVNGAPLAGSRIQLDGSCGSTLYPDGAGIFDRLLPPRTYNAAVYDYATGWGNLVGTVTFTVNAGEVTDLGAVDIPVGAVQGTLLWNGEPLSTQEADPLFAHEEGSFAFWINQSTYSIPNVTPGAHTLEVSLDQCKVGDETKLGESTFSVTAGSTTVADIDLTATAGKLAGAITVNGAPLANGRIQLDGTCGNYFFTNADGIFDRLLPPRTYTATVYDTDAGWGNQIGTWTFGILPGQMTAIEVFPTEPDLTHIEMTVPGLEGITIDFTEVDKGGLTTVIGSGNGKQPPSGYHVVGLTDNGLFYFDINTTATYSGSISVCIGYAQDQVQFPQREDMIQLLHDEHGDGTGWKPITDGPVDTTNNIVCGTAYSLSPFVVVEPLPVDGEDDHTAPVLSDVPADQLLEATSPAGAVASYLPTAIDASDGPVPVSCTPASPATFPLGTTTVICAASDLHGNIASASFNVTVRDTTLPSLALPANLTATATSISGAVVSFTPSASDLADSAPSVSCTPPPGSAFPLGTATVNCAATDHSGNAATGSIPVNVTYAWSGFLQPINTDGSSIFKLGSTVPVKFRLTGASAGITNAVASLSVAKMSNNVAGTETEAVTKLDGDSGNTFRYDASSGQYIFNLSTKPLAKGTYQLRVDLHDGVDSRTVTISLK